MKIPPLLLLLVAGAATAKPLLVPDNAWRQATLNDVAPMLRACLPGGEGLPRLPLAQPAPTDLETPLTLREPRQIGSGYWYRLGWRAKDGSVYLVALRSPDGLRSVFGPVNESWTCLPAELRKELGAK